MEDKLPNDRLEDFLRKSLGDHSEEPPGDLWSKIAGNLEPPVVVQPKLMPIRGGWWAVAAAAAVVVGLLVGQHLYFTSKINQLSKKLEQNVEGLKQLEEEGKTMDLQRNEMEHGTASTEENSVAPQNETVVNTGETKGSYKFETPNFIPKNTTTPETKSNFTKEKKSVKINSGVEQKIPATENLVQKNPASDLVNQSENSPAKLDDAAEPKLESTEKLAAENADLQKVWFKKLSPLDLPALAIPAVAAPIIPAAKLASTHYAVGLNTMPMATKSTVKAVRERGPMEKKSFPLKEEKSSQSWMAGAVCEAQLGPKLRIGTGISYRKLDFQTTHEFEFDFGDSKHGGGPHQDHEHEFQYNLNTAAGTVEMDVRAESAEPAMNIPDDEKIAGEITTNQQFTFVSAPIYANYSIGNGRLRGLLKGGILLNFLKEHDFSVGQIRSRNDKFDFSKREGQKGSPANLQSVTVDYMVGLGLEYDLSKRLSLRLEPTILGSLASRSSNPFVQSSEFSAGLNIGVMYNF